MLEKVNKQFNYHLSHAITHILLICITGKKAPRKKDDLPKPTELMKAREGPLELDKNLNKTIIVNSSGTGAAQPGFYCDICKRTNKDSVAYLDHINGRSRKFLQLAFINIFRRFRFINLIRLLLLSDLRKLGQTTRVVKSTLNDVRIKIAELRAKTAETAEEKKYDFEKRIKEIKAAELTSKADEKEARKKKRAENIANAIEGAPVDQDMMAAMGFGSFA